MGDFLDVLELSDRVISLEPEECTHETLRTGRGSFVVDTTSGLTDETGFVCGQISSSKGVVMPLASEIKEKNMKLRLLLKWEKQIAEEEEEEEEETTSEEKSSSGSPSASSDEEEDVVVAKNPIKVQISRREERKRPLRSKTRQCSSPGSGKTVNMKGLCVGHGGSKLCEHVPSCIKQVMIKDKCVAQSNITVCSDRVGAAQVSVTGVDAAVPKKMCSVPECTRKALARPHMEEVQNAHTWDVPIWPSARAFASDTVNISRAPNLSLRKIHAHVRILDVLSRLNQTGDAETMMGELDALILAARLHLSQTENVLLMVVELDVHTRSVRGLLRLAVSAFGMEEKTNAHVKDAPNVRMRAVCAWVMAVGFDAHIQDVPSAT
ncbi:hypothetical protein PHYPSEUDO_007857 [Phytophthora pseudosyringae]|uniref:Uncharacterized protein n=1 Tax=Phytophthora pseudosyringae TaxID=221518 RepID=A0A8T1VII0_9STRA|nr:hypothetical protein PHYPSEUDO_007857 [Phytophthora pseudosyringae]